MKKILSLVTVFTIVSISSNINTKTILNSELNSFQNLNTFEKNNSDIVIYQEQFFATKGIGFVEFHMAINSNNDIYFIIYHNYIYEEWFIKQEQTTPIKIRTLPSNHVPVGIDWLGNVYFFDIIPSRELSVLENGSDTITKISDEFENVWSVTTNLKYDVIYFGTDKGLYNWRFGTEKPYHIPNIPNPVGDVAFDSNGDVYFNYYYLGKDLDGLWVLKNGSDTPIKIINKVLVSGIAVVPNGDVYFSENFGGLWVLKNGSDTPQKVSDSMERNFVIGSNNFGYIADSYGISFFLKPAISWTKDKSKFTLNDKSKSLSWLSDNQIITNGQLHVIIKNEAIDDIKLNGEILPQVNKTWEFNIPECEFQDKDFTITVDFTFKLNHYKSEIIISSLLSQPNILVSNVAIGQVLQDYPGVLFNYQKVSNIPVFEDVFYSNSEVRLNLIKPTLSTETTGIIFGLKSKWEKNGKKQNFDLTTPVNLDGSQLDTYQGRYLIEIIDSAGNKQSYYLVVSSDVKNKITNFWDTAEGKEVETQALLHKYTDKQLHNLNVKAVQHVIDQYNSKKWDTKLDLQIIIKNLTFNNAPNSTKTYKDLITNILNAPEFNGLKLSNPIIDFQDMLGKDISNEKQHSGQFQIQIKADNNDINWTGTTNITTNLKINLDTIISLNIDSLIADKTKTYKELTTDILNAPEFKNDRLVNPIIKFFDMEGNDITNNNELPGKFQIQITSSDIDPDWIGTTKKITLDLGENWTPVNPAAHTSNGLSTAATIGIIIAVFSVIGISWLVMQFQVIPRLKMRKMIKKHNKELQEFETKENLKE